MRSPLTKKTKWWESNDPPKAYPPFLRPIPGCADWDRISPRRCRTSNFVSRRGHGVCFRTGERYRKTMQCYVPPASSKDVPEAPPPERRADPNQLRHHPHPRRLSRSDVKISPYLRWGVISSRYECETSCGGIGLTFALECLDRSDEVNPCWSILTMRFALLWTTCAEVMDTTTRRHRSDSGASGTRDPSSWTPACVSFGLRGGCRGGCFCWPRLASLKASESTGDGAGIGFGTPW
jgi:hypothetical protein